MSVFIASQDTRTDFMLTAMPNTHFPGHSHAGGPDTSDVVETRLWMEEHNWLYGLLRSSDNVAPTFRIPDLLSACVAIIFSRDDAAERIFGFLGTALVMRSPTTPRRSSAPSRRSSTTRSPAKRICRSTSAAAATRCSSRWRCSRWSNRTVRSRWRRCCPR